MKFLRLSLIIASVFAVASCGSETAPEAPPQETAPEAPRQETAPVPRSAAASPAEAYGMLFGAVKGKDSESIKSVLSLRTLEFAKGISSQRGETLEQVIRNGFSAPTKGDTMPAIRDVQVVDGFASIEVYNSAERRWEMVPLIYEDGGWKIAVGDAFGNSWKQPGKTQSQREMESSNTMRPQRLPGSNIDFNKIKPQVIDPTRGNVNAGPNPTLNQNIKPVKIPTH
jgi:hypothetical protein